MIQEIEKVLNLVNEMTERMVGLAKCLDAHDKQIESVISILKDHTDLIQQEAEKRGEIIKILEMMQDQYDRDHGEQND